MKGFYEDFDTNLLGDWVDILHDQLKTITLESQERTFDFRLHVILNLLWHHFHNGWPPEEYEKAEAFLVRHMQRGIKMLREHEKSL